MKNNVPESDDSYFIRRIAELIQMDNTNKLKNFVLSQLGKSNSIKLEINPYSKFIMTIYRFSEDQDPAALKHVPTAETILEFIDNIGKEYIISAKKNEQYTSIYLRALHHLIDTALHFHQHINNIEKQRVLLYNNNSLPTVNTERVRIIESLDIESPSSRNSLTDKLFFKPKELQKNNYFLSPRAKNTIKTHLGNNLTNTDILKDDGKITSDKGTKRNFIIRQPNRHPTITHQQGFAAQEKQRKQYMRQGI
jgi:hypothetical protein